MKIGLFDHIERADRPIATTFDERLKFAVARAEVNIDAMSLPDVLRSLALFSTEVMPKLTDL